jgi:hypothetical protein
MVFFNDSSLASYTCNTRRIVGYIVFYAVSVVPKENDYLFLDPSGTALAKTSNNS